MNMNKYSLVLSGGGALGYAHLSVIEEIEKFIIDKPSELIGTSMGAIIAASLATGRPLKETKEILKANKNIFNLIGFSSLSTKSIISEEKIDKLLSEYFFDLDFKSLSTPLKVIATNLETGEKEVFSKENNVPVKDAVMASISLPILFKPKSINGIKYIDGAFSSNCAIEEASEKQAIVSDVLGDKSYTRYKDISSVETAMRIMISNQTKVKLKQNKKFHYINIDCHNTRTSDFHKIDKIFNYGYGYIPKLNL